MLDKPILSPKSAQLLGVAFAVVSLCLFSYLIVQVAIEAYGLSRDRIQGWSLEQETRLIGANVAREQEIIEAVIAGKCSLSEAAAEFRHLHERLPAQHRSRLRANYSDADAPELFERRVLFLVASRLESHPEEQAAVLHRLESELKQKWRHPH